MTTFVGIEERETNTYGGKEPPYTKLDSKTTKKEFKGLKAKTGYKKIKKTTETVKIVVK